MNLRTVQSAEDLGTSTTTTGVTKARLTFTGTAGDEYWVLGCATVGAVGSTHVILSWEDLLNGELFYMESLIPYQATDYYNWPLLGRITLPSGSPNFDVQMSGTVGGGGAPFFPTIDIRETRIIAIKTHPMDFAADDFLSGGSTSSTSYATIVSHTFDVPRAGDYLIVCTCKTQKLVTSSSYNVRLLIDGVAYGTSTMRSITTTALMGLPYQMVRKVTLAAGSHTIEVQARTITSGNVGLTQVGLLGLRCDTFARTHYHESLTESSTTSSTYATKVSVNVTPQAKPHIVIAQAYVRRQTDPIRHQTLDGATVVQAGQYESPAGVGGAAAQCTLSALEYVTPGSRAWRTWATQYATDGVGASTGFITEAAICALQVSDDTTLRLYGGQYDGGIYG